MEFCWPQFFLSSRTFKLYFKTKLAYVLLQNCSFMKTVDVKTLQSYFQILSTAIKIILSINPRCNTVRFSNPFCCLRQRVTKIHPFISTAILTNSLRLHIRLLALPLQNPKPSRLNLIIDD